MHRVLPDFLETMLLVSAILFWEKLGLIFKKGLFPFIPLHWAQVRSIRAYCARANPCEEFWLKFHTTYLPGFVDFAVKLELEGLWSSTPVRRLPKSPLAALAPARPPYWLP